MRLRNKVWFDARAQQRAGRTIQVAPPDTAPVTGRLSYREVLRRAAAAAAAAPAEAGSVATIDYTDRS